MSTEKPNDVEFGKRIPLHAVTNGFKTVSVSVLPISRNGEDPVSYIDICKNSTGQFASFKNVTMSLGEAEAIAEAILTYIKK